MQANELMAWAAGNAVAEEDTPMPANEWPEGAVAVDLQGRFYDAQGNQLEQAQ